MATGYPGYCGIIPKSCATFAEMLKHAGYSSAWFGKNHNVPDNLTSPAGPFDNWPTYQGFDYFYGFISGETDQFYPSLLRNTTPVEPPKRPEEGYHLTKDLAEEYIGFVCKFMVGMGLAFEMPMILLFLVKIGILNYEKLSSLRMYAVVANIILAAVITPTGDPVTLALVAVPMQLLYELSTIIAWFMGRKQAREEAAFDDED